MFEKIKKMFTRKKVTLRSTLETLNAGLLRSTRPSARAHADWKGSALDCSNNMLVSEGERARLRAWAKGEYLDNPLARNIARNFALGVYGAGPILQVQTHDDSLNDRVEALFRRWRTAVELDNMFLDALQALFYDGEAFFHFTPNPGKPGGLDLELIEARRVQEPFNAGTDRNRLEGITYNEYNEPIFYDIVEENNNPQYDYIPQTTVVPASHIMHLFFADVVNQRRGLPLLQSALEMLSSLRRITNASLGAWELAARMNLIIETGMEAADLIRVMPGAAIGTDSEEAVDVEAFDVKAVPENGGMTFLPTGMSMNQVKNEHPNSNFTDHCETFQKMAGLAGGLPENLSIGSSAKYNFSSAQMDYQIFSRYAGACQRQIKKYLNKCVETSLAYMAVEGDATASEIVGLYPQGALPIDWHFPTMLSQLDRNANASGDVQLLQAGLLTHREYCKRYGIDYKQHMEDWLHETREISAAKAENV